MIVRYLTLALLITCVCSINTTAWEHILTHTSYLALNNQIAFRTDATNAPSLNGYPLLKYDYTSQTWGDAGGACSLLSVGSTISCCALLSVTGVYNYLSDNSWNRFDDYGLSEIKAGRNDDVWYLRQNLVAGGGGYEVCKRGATSNPQSGLAAVKVGVGPIGQLYLINDQGVIKRNPGRAAWETLPGKANDIIVGGDSIPVIVSQNPTEGGYEIQRYDEVNKVWVTLEGIGGIVVTLDTDNNPYVVTGSHDVYRPRGIVTRYCPSKFPFFKN